LLPTFMSSVAPSPEVEEKGGIIKDTISSGTAWTPSR
jgi:hypothetical protein